MANLALLQRRALVKASQIAAREQARIEAENAAAPVAAAPTSTPEPVQAAAPTLPDAPAGGSGLYGPTDPVTPGPEMTPWQNSRWAEALYKGETAQDLANQYADNGVTLDQIQSVLDTSGKTLPDTSGLTEWQRGVFADALISGKTAADIGTQQGVSTERVNSVLGAANLSLPQAPISPAGVPAQVAGQIPNTPHLRMMQRSARRRAMVGWKGQTDSILTSGQGATGPANLATKTLLGS